MAEFNNYKRNLLSKKEDIFYVLPWASVILKNCDEQGELLVFKTKKHYKDQTKSLWLQLKLHFFRDNVS